MLNEILISNQSKINLTYSFIGSGMAKIIKLKDEKLEKTTKIKSREFSFKNILRKVLRKNE